MAFCGFGVGLSDGFGGGLGFEFERREGPPPRDTKDRVWAMGLSDGLGRWAWAMGLGDGFGRWVWAMGLSDGLERWA